MSRRVGISISEHFDVDPEWLKRIGVFNATLDIDSPLFIDPFLLPESKHKEFSECAFDAYEAHFGAIYALLRASENQGDKAWSGALKKFKFGEAKGLNGTCLGYSKRSTKGRGFGRVLSGRALVWATEVIKLGVKDPELFSSMSLFEKGIGPDLISDMVTNITLECIIKFNNRVLSALEKEVGRKIQRNPVQLNAITANLPVNPYSNDGSPIILLPADILKHLPLMDDPRSLSNVALHNEQLRDRVNSHISEIFKVRTKKEKEAIKSRAMESAAAFQTLLDLLKIIEKKPYDVIKDPEGLLEWRPLAQTFSSLHKLEIKDDPTLPRLDRIDCVCITIIKQFQSLVEDHRLSRMFYVDGKARHERFAQLLFYAISVAYCDANDLDISPEADAGAGPVDFKFSSGTDKVVVEIKLSTNSKVVEGYEKQLDAYMKAEKTKRSHYIVIDVGKIGRKWERLESVVKANPHFAKLRRIYLVDGTPRASASTL